MTANNSNGTKKLLDYWEKPPEAGEPLGCLSTSYTFNAAHYEEQCLARFVGCSTTLEEDDVLFRVDLETRLSQLDAAAAFVDQHKAKGIRNLRWDLIPVRVPKGVLHAKITVLCWMDWIRLIIASANLTPDGYRRNNEIFACIDYYQDAVAPKILLYNAIEFYRKLMDVYTTVGRERKAKIIAFLDREKEASAKWNIREPEKGLSYHLGLVWPDKKDSILSQMNDKWPEQTPPNSAWIESPFYDDDAEENLPAEKLWSIMRQRGEVEVHYNARGRKDVKTNIVELDAPETLVKTKPARNSTKVYFHLVENIFDGQARSLHAKTISISGDRWKIYCVGSSNFTTPGLGLGRRTGSGNIEANLLTVVDMNRWKKEAGAIDNIITTVSEEVPLDRIKWLPVNEESEQGFSYLALPMFFSGVIYDAIGKEGGKLCFQFTGALDQPWEIILPTADESGEKLLHREAWIGMGMPKVWEAPWNSRSVPSELEIIMNNGRAILPVMIASQSSIPLPDLLDGLTLEDIAELLMVKGDYDRMLRKLVSRRNAKGEKKTYLDNDPHKRVNTTTFLMQRTRRVAGVLRALRSKLEQPVMTYESLQFRLRGPLGVGALAKAIIREGSTEDERAFLLTELMLELSRIKPREYPGSLAAQKVMQQIIEVRKEIKLVVVDNKDMLSKSMEQYITSVHQEMGE